MDATRTLFSFACIGVVSTLAYVAGALALGHLGAGAVSASITAYACGMLISYFGHRSVTFRSNQPHRDGIPRFILLNILGLTLAVAIPFLFDRFLGLPSFVAVVTTAIAVPLASFIGHNRFVFPAASRNPEASFTG
jgi:putative flippase GtrA